VTHHEARHRHFDRLYAASDDPWGYRISAYEAGKYALTLASLQKPRYARGLEIGCSNGELSWRLALRCDRLVAVDLSERAAESARQRLSRRGNAQVQVATVPQDWPSGRYDLIIFSEVLYYLDKGEMQRLVRRVSRCLQGRGEILLVNWLGETGTAVSGREAANSFIRGLRRLCRFHLDLTRRPEFVLHRLLLPDRALPWIHTGPPAAGVASPRQIGPRRARDSAAKVIGQRPASG
jgi:predicted O-methyltransferase YrrM